MLPRLAAMVSRTITGIRNFFCSAMDRTSMVNGTKVISATSLVISMLKKKHRKMKSADSIRRECTWVKSMVPSRVKTPMEENPRTTAIRENKRASTRKSI